MGGFPPGFSESRKADGVSKKAIQADEVAVSQRVPTLAFLLAGRTICETDCSLAAAGYRAWALLVRS
jgi:hypothetical protein